MVQMRAMREQNQYSLRNSQLTTPVNALSTGKWWSESILRLLSVLFSGAILGMSAFYYMHWTIGALVMMGPPAGVAILWDFVDAICLCARSSHEGVPAGARILVDLILFLAFAAMSSVLAFTVSKLSDSGFYFAFFQDGVGAEYLYIALIFGFLAAIVHLTILIMACYESKRRPTASTAPQIVYVEVNPDGSVVPVGQQPQLAFSREEPPPSYSPPTDSPSRLLDQIEASELPTTSAVQEKKG